MRLEGATRERNPPTAAGSDKQKNKTEKAAQMNLHPYGFLVAKSVFVYGLIIRISVSFVNL